MRPCGRALPGPLDGPCALEGRRSVPAGPGPRPPRAATCAATPPGPACADASPRTNYATPTPSRWPTKASSAGLRARARHEGESGKDRSDRPGRADAHRRAACAARGVEELRKAFSSPALARGVRRPNAHGELRARMRLAMTAVSAARRVTKRSADGIHPRRTELCDRLCQQPTRDRSQVVEADRALDRHPVRGPDLYFALDHADRSGHECDDDVSHPR